MQAEYPVTSQGRPGNPTEKGPSVKKGRKQQKTGKRAERCAQKMKTNQRKLAKSSSDETFYQNGTGKPGGGPTEKETYLKHVQRRRLPTLRRKK